MMYLDTFKSCKMKIALVSIFLYISFYSSAQVFPKYHYNPKGFNTIFMGFKKGCFNGHADGMLQFEYINGDKFIATFSQDSAQLYIEPDTLEIYDVSSKHYSVKTRQIQIDYATYSKANAIRLTIGNEIYILSIIDGACWGAIDGLDYEYISDGNKEILIIHFSDKVFLYPVAQFYGLSHYSLKEPSPAIYILKGSTLIFHINK